MIPTRFFLAAFVLLGAGLSCSTSRSVNQPSPYVPVDRPLYDTLVALDSILFDAFSNCRLEVFQFVVPAGTWFASEPGKESAFSLVGCTVAPGFDFADFELAEYEQLSSEFPQHSTIIRRLCR